MRHREILVVAIGNRWRVVTYPNEVQWFLQQDGRTIAWCRSRMGLESNIRERMFPDETRALREARTMDAMQQALASLGTAITAIEALPEWFPEEQYATR